MSVRMMTLVWELALPPGEKLVLLALADQGNDEGTQCWPSVETIAHRSGQGVRTVRRCLASLEAAGHLTRDHRDGTSTQYRVHPCQIGTPAKLAPLPKTTKTPAKLAPKPLRNTKGSEAKASSPRVKFPAPPGVSDEQWEAFRDQRKKALNARSYTLLCNKLLKLAEDGWPPGDMIDLAIERGWETVFTPRTFPHERPDPTLDALNRFQQIVGDVGAGAGTGEMPQAGSAGIDGFGRAVGMDRLSG